MFMTAYNPFSYQMPVSSLNPEPAHEANPLIPYPF